MKTAKWDFCAILLTMIFIVFLIKYRKYRTRDKYYCVKNACYIYSVIYSGLSSFQHFIYCDYGTPYLAIIIRWVTDPLHMPIHWRQLCVLQETSKAEPMHPWCFQCVSTLEQFKNKYVFEPEHILEMNSVCMLRFSSGLNLTPWHAQPFSIFQW